jgi:membrane-bound lytic murein transglycosylase D
MRDRSRFLAAFSFAAAFTIAGCSLAPRSPVPEPVTASVPAPRAPVPAATRSAAAPDRLAPRPLLPGEAPPPPADLIARIYTGFELPGVDDAVVAEELAWYAQNPDYVARVFDRGSRYLFHIAEALEERGMPADLALLPIVESAFDPIAYSRGRASGLWQIIPGTGDRLGL